MKKTFRSILAGAIALLAVSCYDDSDLQKKYGDLNDRVTAIENVLNAEVGGIDDLAARLLAAEGKVATLEGAFTTAQTSILTRLDAIDGAADGKIKNLQDAIAALQNVDTEIKTDLAEAIAKIAIVSVEEVDGSWKFTPAVGEPFLLSKPLANVNNSGLVTIVPVDGVDYWAVVGADGAAVSTDVPVGHPDYQIAFQVTSDGKLTYTVNGGEPVETGVSTSDLSGQRYLINEVEVAENGKYVTITIGEAEYVLPMYEPTPTIKLKSGKTFFDSAETKEVEIKLEGVSNLVVMNQPYGWKAKVRGSILTVTAPSEGNVDAEKDGVVVLHGSANGQCITAALPVSAGPGFELSVDNAGNITVYNPVVVTIKPQRYGAQPYDDFIPALIGITKASIFESYSSIEELHELMMDDYEGAYGGYTYTNNAELGQSEYNPETCVVDTYTFSFAHLCGCFWPELVPEKGEKYVVFAIPQDSDVPNFDDLVYAYYEPVSVEYNETITSTSIDLEVAVYGAKGFVAGAVSLSYLNNAGETPITFDQYMNQDMQGKWYQFKTYEEFSALGQELESGDVVSVAELVYEEDLIPGETYYVWLMPVKEGKDIAEYSYENDLLPYVYRIKTTPLEKGAPESEVSLNEDETNYTTIAVDITPAEGAKVYYEFYRAGAVDDMTEDELVATTISACIYPSENEKTVTMDYLSDGTTMTFVAVTVVDGKYSLVQLPVQSLAYPRTDAIVASVKSIVDNGGGEYTVVINVEGDATMVALALEWSAGSEDTDLPAEIFENGAAGTISEDYYTASVNNGEATFVLNKGYFPCFQFIAYKVVGDSVLMSGYAEGEFPTSEEDDLGGGFWPMLP